QGRRRSAGRVWYGGKGRRRVRGSTVVPDETDAVVGPVVVETGAGTELGGTTVTSIVAKPHNTVTLGLFEQEVHVGADRQGAGQHAEPEFFHAGAPAGAYVHTTDLQLALVGKLDVHALDGTCTRVTFQQPAEAIRIIELEVRVQAVHVETAVDDDRCL